MRENKILESNIKELQRQLQESYKRISDLNAKIDELEKLNADIRISQQKN